MASCVDPELWKVCSGSMVQVPLVDSKVFYFPQGHAEHANGTVNFNDYPEVPSMVECRVASVKYMADSETDDLYLRMRLVPLRMNGVFLEPEEDDLVGNFCQDGDGEEKILSFSKTLTQSDANNGGGFSVPKYCAESLFPALDYSADPPVQNLHLKDVHGMVWKFRHIYRGTPRRHLLTTGWSTYVNHKKLISGDSVVFMRATNGELFIGTRRLNRGLGKAKCGWTPPGGSWDSSPHSGYSMLENGSIGVKINYEIPRMSGKVSVESVIESAQLASAGKAFEVDYYPRAGSAEFCVKASGVRAASRTHWCAGMKFKMPFETEDASKVSWFAGTIQAVQSADPSRWPNSPWRMLQVAWEDSNLLHNVERVSPWLVDIVASSMPNMHVVPYSQPMKRLRLAQPSDVPSSSQHPAALYPHEFNPNLSYYSVADNAPAGIQGARHVQLGQYPNLNNISNPRQVPEFRQPFTAPQPAPVGANITSRQGKKDISSLLTLGKLPPTPKENEETASTGFVLFGKRIVMEEKMSPRSSVATANSNTLSDGGDIEKVGKSAESSGSGSVQNRQECCSSGTESPGCRSCPSTEMEPPTSGCLPLEQNVCHPSLSSTI
ncbi:unnamed protein product [Rhodiola kirilowii]